MLKAWVPGGTRVPGLILALRRIMGFSSMVSITYDYPQNYRYLYFLFEHLCQMGLKVWPATPPNNGGLGRTLQTYSRHCVGKSLERVQVNGANVGYTIIHHVQPCGVSLLNFK